MKKLLGNVAEFRVVGKKIEEKELVGKTMELAFL